MPCGYPAPGLGKRVNALNKTRGLVIGVGGPLATNAIRPTDEELFERYNPELKKKSLEGRDRRQQDFDDFVRQLKEDSKSSKPSEQIAESLLSGQANAISVWVVQKERQEREKKAKEQADRQAAEDLKSRKADLRREAGLPPLSKA